MLYICALPLFLHSTSKGALQNWLVGQGSNLDSQRFKAVRVADYTTHQLNLYSCIIYIKCINQPIHVTDIKEQEIKEFKLNILSFDIKNIVIKNIKYITIKYFRILIMFFSFLLFRYLAIITLIMFPTSTTGK